MFGATRYVAEEIAAGLGPYGVVTVGGVNGPRRLSAVPRVTAQDAFLRSANCAKVGAGVPAKWRIMRLWNAETLHVSHRSQRSRIGIGDHLELTGPLPRILHDPNWH